jgi:HSP20 family molecular chaperone IbpA
MDVDELVDQDEQSPLSAKMQELRQLLLNDDSWRGLRLEPNFSVSQQRDRFVLQAYIPNMDRREISVDLSQDGGTLVIRGFRKPSREEAEELLQQLSQDLHEGRVDLHKLLAQPNEEALLAMGKGRFGSFVAQYRLPPRGVARDRIQASYHNGALTVTVPIQQQVEPDQFGVRGRSLPSLFGGFPW